MKKLNAIQYIVLITDDYSRAKEFYTAKLGFSIDEEVPEDEYVQFQLDNLIIALFSRRKMTQVLPEKYLHKGGGALFTFAQVDDVDETVAELKSKGITFIGEPKTQPWGQRTAYFTDPDGHIWEIQKWLK